MTIAVPTILGLSYFGVVVLPHLAVHSANASDPSLIGDWRGHFPHKNVAAPAMVFSVFFGLYVLRAKSLLAGSAIIGLAAVFLWNTGSKTSIAMLPSILVLGWMFERIRILRPVVVLGGLVAVNVILMSAATSSTLQSFLVSLGIDPSFTDRTSIWSVGLDAFARNPITGYGFRSFWQTEALFRSDFSLYTWAVTAAHAHNGYLEQLLNGGMVGLVLVLIWLVLLPIGYASRAFAGPNNSDLTRLFLRLWLFSLFLACLESPIFENTGPIWFAMLVSVFGLRLQAYALLLDPSPRKAATGSNTIVAANCR
ncbi:O-antigen ligase family protein [Roseibium sp. SCP14]|uniref:O-antigen ligase family protein n=1 Tax=Roseibium sp. SCP14 TaxID=3141375 RepID=UPI00333C3EF3